MKKQALLNKLKQSKLYGFTPDRFLEKRNILNIIEEQCRFGVDIIQLREKTISDREKLELARQIKKITVKYNKLFIVNDDILIAKYSDADGIHLGQNDLPIEIAYSIMPDKIIGLSTHNFKQYKDAQEIDEIDYTAIGPIFETKTKINPDPFIGIENLDNILLNKKKITVGIGGIKLNNINKIVKYNIDIIAVVTGIITGNIKDNIEQFKKYL